MSKGYVNIYKDIALLLMAGYQIACIYIVVRQKKWNNTYLETAYKLEWGNIANFCFQDERLTTTKTS